MSDSTEDSRFRAYQAALEALQTPLSLRHLSRKWNISRDRIKRHMGQIDSIADTAYDPETYVHDVPPLTSNKGRKPALNKQEENTLAEAIKHFVECNTPLMKKGFLDLAEEQVSALPVSRQQEIGFKNNRPSEYWIRSFMNRHPELQLKAPSPVEWKRISAVSPDNLAPHYTRIESAIERFNIKDGRFIFNLDESGISLKKLLCKAYKKGFGIRGKPLFSMDAPVKGNLDHVTIMPVISASDDMKSPVAVFPGKQPHWRKVNGDIQTLHRFLPPGTLLYHRDPAGVDGDIFHDWAREFVKETAPLREGNQKLLLVLDGYGAHRRYSTLKLLHDNDIVVIGLPAHESHVLQPLDVSVFGPFKQHLRSAILTTITGLSMKKLDVFDLCQLITEAYNKALSRDNIVSGFRRTGIWDNKTGKPCLKAMQLIRFTAQGSTPDSNVSPETDTQEERALRFKQLVTSFREKRRAILSSGVIDKEGTVTVESTESIHLTADTVLSALKGIEDRRKLEAQTRKKREEAKKKRVAEKAIDADRIKRAKEVRRARLDAREETELQKLAPVRRGRRDMLSSSRAMRRRTRYPCREGCGHELRLQLSRAMKQRHCRCLKSGNKT